jgi:hypothetical protein
MTREEIGQKLEALARENCDTHDPEFQKRFMNWLGGFGRWRIESRGRA